MIEFGMDWYPEQWDPSLWEDDLIRMKKLGIRIVRIGEFAWSALEGEEGKYTFDWLDEVMDLCKKHGMKVILGTPTNCPPQWLYKNYPETIRLDRTGSRLHYGVRGHRCMTSARLRKACQDIIGQLTARYKDHPMLYGWQIDNEVEANSCTCLACTQSFIRWLKTRYKSLEELNKAWGMHFWSHDFSDWNEVSLQIPANRQRAWYNPAFMLDVTRWKAESLDDFVRFQYDLLKQATPHLPVTTNFCLNRETPGYHSLGKILDVASYDNYPPNALYGKTEPWSYSNAMVLDYVRGFKRDNFWVMEQLAGPMGCWGPIQPALVPGMIEGYGIQAIAHGCNLEMFFRWRTAAKGAEMFCYGLLDHDNADNRRLGEARKLIERISKIEDLDQTVFKADAAILYGRDQEEMLNIQNQGFDYFDQIRRMHGALTELGIGCDVIDQAESLEGYKLVIVPSHFVYSPGLEKKLEEYVQAGGLLVMSARSGALDSLGNAFSGQMLPGPFSSLLGITIRETDALNGEKVSLHMAEKEEAAGAVNSGFMEAEDKSTCPSFLGEGWNDLIEPQQARTMYVYADRFYAGTPAITERDFGQGQAWYIGTILNEKGYKKLLEQILEAGHVPYLDNLPEGIEITKRSNDKNEYLFIFNNTLEPKQFVLENEPIRMAGLEARICKNRSEWL